MVNILSKNFYFFLDLENQKRLFHLCFSQCFQCCDVYDKGVYDKMSMKMMHRTKNLGISDRKLVKIVSKLPKARNGAWWYSFCSSRRAYFFPDFQNAYSPPHVNIYHCLQVSSWSLRISSKLGKFEYHSCFLKEKWLISRRNLKKLFVISLVVYSCSD